MLWSIVPRRIIASVAIGIVCIQLVIVDVTGNKRHSSDSNGNGADADRYDDDKTCSIVAMASSSSSEKQLIHQNPTPLYSASSNDAGNKVDDDDDDDDDQLNEEWNWDPTSLTHPCTIRRISRSELQRHYGPSGLPNLEYPYPIIIYPDDDDDDDDENDENEQQQWSRTTHTNTKFANLTTYTNLPINFPPNFQVTLSGSDSLSSYRRTISLQQYLTEIINANDGSGTTKPTQLGNETWYFFGETHSSIWSTFLEEHYMLPPCQSCTRPNVKQQQQEHPQQHVKIALSFGIGNIGSGVQWHIHGPGFSETIHGRKHWVLYPPDNEPLYDLNFASRHWMENTYPTLEDWTTEEIRLERKKHEEFWQRWKNTRQQKMEEEEDEEEWGHNFRSVQMLLSRVPDTVESGPSKRKPWECTVHEGEIIYFPNMWHHATINLEKYTVFVSSFT